MGKFFEFLFLFLMYTGALCVYPFITFVIVMNKWAEWIDKNIKEILN